MFVNAENKLDYIRALFYHKMVDSIRYQLGFFLKGFYEIIPLPLISVFDIQELELLISGLEEVDIQDWKTNTVYTGIYNADHKVIRWFWDIIENKFDNEQRLRFIQFVTGSSRIPVGGFALLFFLFSFSLSFLS